MAGAPFAGALAQETAAPQAEAPPSATPTDSGTGVISYPPSFFVQFRPANAQDMVNRLPGFTFNEGEDVRGFGGAAGNVLIDGERPSSKSVPLDQLLQRIPGHVGGADRPDPRRRARHRHAGPARRGQHHPQVGRARPARSRCW